VSSVAKPVFADHLDVSDIYSRVKYRLEDFVVGLCFFIQTAAAVTLPPKLAGGPVPGLGAVWLIAGLLCFGFALTKPLQTLKATIWAWPFVALTVWIWLSYSWTIEPYETLRGILLISCAHIFAISVAARFSWHRIIEILAWTLCSLVAFSIILAVFLPKMGQMQGELAGAWSGAWDEKQSLGFHACFGLVAAMAMLWRGPKYRLWWIGIALCLVAIVGSTGKTALVMVVVAIAAGLWLRIFYRGFFGKVTGSWLAALGGIALVPLASGTLGFLLTAFGKSTDFTGRTGVWEAVKNVADMRPNQGWGFQTIWRDKDSMTSPFQWITDRVEFLPANAHSSWLDAYLQLGRPGVVLLVVCMVWAWLGIFVRPKTSNIAIAFSGAILAAITFISFTETNLVTSMELQWVLVVLLTTKLFLGDSDTSESPANSNQMEAEAHSGILEGDTFTYSD
jgi:exopolysaccharide production protein ExoQ